MSYAILEPEKPSRAKTNPVRIIPKAELITVVEAIYPRILVGLCISSSKYIDSSTSFSKDLEFIISELYELNTLFSIIDFSTKNIVSLIKFLCDELVCCKFEA